jgi:hypothetical protein
VNPDNHAFWKKIMGCWRPKPIVPPTIDEDFTELDGLTRATESWRFAILSWEYWLCPSGILREYIRQIIKLAMFIAAPALLLVPLSTFILSQLVQWAAMLTAIAWKLIVLPILLLIGAIVTAFNWLMFKASISSKR